MNGSSPAHPTKKDLTLSVFHTSLSVVGNGMVSWSPDSLKTLDDSRTEEILIMVKDQKVKGLIILAAFLSFLLSVYLWFSGQKDEGLFVAIWVPSILSFGALWLLGRGANR